MAEESRPDHQRPPTPASPYPWLLLPDGEDKKKQMFYDVYEGSRSEKSVPELEHQMYPISSNFGWVVLMGDYDPEQQCLTGGEGYYLWNPVTLEAKPLPPLQLESPREYIIGMQLTAPADNPDSTFAMFVAEPRCIYLCRINDGDKVWVRRDCSEEITDWHVYFRTVVCNDKIYSLQERPRLMWEIEIGKEKPLKALLKPINFTEPSCQSNCRDYWVESSGEIFCIKLEPGLAEVMRNVVVSKLDLSNNVLKEIKSFPDKVFFVDLYDAVCCPAHSENMGNKVFFTLPNSNVLYTYDAEDQNISTTIPFPGIPSVISSTLSWMLPNLPPSQMIARRSQSVAPMEEIKVKNNLSSPCLILPLIHKRVISIVGPLDEGVRKCFPTVPSQVPDNARIHYSRNGWLLMSAAGVPSVKSLFMYNPLTKDVVPLPVLEMDDYEDTNDFFFLSSPESSDFLVVAINYLVVFALIRPGVMKKWKVFDVPLVGYRLSAFHSSHVFIGDTLYYIGDTGNLHVVRVKEPDSFFLTSVEVTIPGNDSYQQSYLVACYGQLLAVHVGDAGKSVKVFKLNGSGTGMGWNPVKSLGEKCLFLSKVSTLAVKSEIPKMKNRIYFGRFYGESMVYYSMETSKLHYSVLREGSLVEKSLDDFDGTIEHLNSCWFEPKLKTQEEPTDPASSVMTDKLVRRSGLKLIDDSGRIKTNLLSRHLSKHMQL